jgi:TGF-beta propeptide
MNWFLRVVLVGLAVGLAIPVATARAVSITVQPSSQHATFAMTSTYPSTAGPRLTIGRDFDEIWRSALKFDVSAVPGGSTITRATLRVYHDGKCFRGDTGAGYLAPCTSGANHAVAVHRLLAPWAPGSTSEALSMEASALNEVAPQSLSTPQWISLDVTAAVDVWVSGQPNYGLLLKRSSEGTPGSMQTPGGIAPLSATHGDPALRPKLEIEYADQAYVTFSLAMPPEDVASWAAVRGLTLNQLVARHDGFGSTFEAFYVVQGDEADLGAAYRAAIGETWVDFDGEMEADSNVSESDLALADYVMAEHDAGHCFVSRATVTGSSAAVEALRTDPSVVQVHTRSEAYSSPDDTQPYTGEAWWPFFGKIVTRNSPNYVSRRFIYESFIWTPERLEKLQSYEKEGYEHEAWYDNYDDRHFLGKITTAASSMPSDYLDTEALNPEGNNELGYTIGTSRGSDLIAAKFYEIFIRTKLGNANTDRGKVQGARTHRRIGPCDSRWCMKQNQVERFIPAWDFAVPGVMLWNN